ncbi:ArsR family transcriptional regulator [Roseivirga pacifica]|uniref:Transcriptional regulator, ArsR family n=1 Tax=Roseivirga pacifica TaxID=1267423 RepID=A0A1I0MF74_9BACT|nr:metalloregulator ArsR/SmtB family transcription factor [Roseivirga pacifica]MCO6358833.1 metalloregulator ArsR/SmtB family transcription factor [Roseivirga pacifica]MCO6365531.1 metalloregulator ArsR/SmtB family transcription factor [Roseivirga pacifica]MCO6371739.1 metalloregulator ArsR/SmtB family transcription factor [Roseivirga pacifica]MCO6376150.1 metalloregulator ArsR/SmtB family transcription factor [Roseivirga pacifica]MCO6379117.1 metalloregulator ArsR/SmtB family transcription fa|tara:strand:- start:838 stop:1221 length:384 start_codon:yes stop_codon:yes gene_type:complete
MRLKNFSLSFGSQIFKSFSEEARVRMLHLFYKNGELTISDLEHILDFTQTKTSRHITYLKNAGIINARKADQWVFYSIREEVEEIINQIFNFLNKDSVLIKDQEVYSILESNRELAKSRIQNRHLLG